MNTELLLQITSFLIVFISFLLAFFLFTVKSKNKIGNILLAFYLIIRAINVSSYFYYEFIDLPIDLELLRMDIGSFIEIPFLYLFVLSIIYSDFELKKIHLIHLIPFLLVTIIQIPTFYLADLEIKNEFADNYLYNTIGVFSMVLANLQNLFYIILIFIVLFKYSKILKENYAISDDFNNQWLFKMNVFLSVLFIIAIIKNIQKYGDLNLTLFQLSVSIGILLFTCWLVLKALYAPKIFTGIDSKIQLVRHNISKNESQNDNITEKIDKLKSYMLDQQPFLNPDFTIQELSNRIQIDIREVSHIINHHLNLNFYEFVNNYRIDEAKKRLLKDKKYTVLEILYQVGFNSKSSFNTQFKKATGTTPTQFRKKSM